MRKIIAVWTAKLAILAGRMLGKMSSSTPGRIALKICPNLIRKLSKEIKNDIIIICGTNGKTTTNNLINHILKEQGLEICCNSTGANMIDGVATALVEKCGLWGKMKADYAAFEVDEAYMTKLFDHLTPNLIVLTNLFRDQLDRYGNTDATLRLIKNAIEKTDKPIVIVNGDDPQLASLGKMSEVNIKYYGIEESNANKGNNTNKAGKSNEGKNCPICGEHMEYSFYHYANLGGFSCPSCGFKRARADYSAENAETSSGLEFTVGENHITFNTRGFYNIYNLLAAYAAISELGLDTNRINDYIASYRTQTGRMQTFELNKPVILNLAKNPAGFNQAIAAVAEDKRSKDVIIAVNDRPSDGEDVSWLWDVDFELLNTPETGTVYLCGERRYDVALRLKYNPECKICFIPEDSVEKAIDETLKTENEVCYALVNYTMLFGTSDILNRKRKTGEKG